MTKHEAERLTRQTDTLIALGFTRDEADALRRISMTLRRWHEHECNGTIQRDGENGDGRPYWYNPSGPTRAPRRPGAYIPDRERGAEKRLKAIIGLANARRLAGVDPETGQPQAYADGHLACYLQTDPRGAALYILRPGDVPEGGSPSSYYSRGICVY